MAHHAVRLQVGEQHVDVDAGAADPTVDQFAARLRLAADLREVEERGVGGEDAAAGVDDDERLRHRADEAQQV